MIITVPTTELLERLAGRLPEGVEARLWAMDGPSGIERIDLAVLPYMAPATILDVLDGEDVGHVQSQALGFDKVDQHLPQGVGFSNAVGVHEDSTAEHTLALVLAAQRDLPLFVERQPQGSWEQPFSPGLLGRTVLVVGVGGVGGAIAHRLVPFGVELLRSASRGRSDELGQVHGPEALDELVSQGDVVIAALPLTEQTRHTFDAARIARMKPGALLVNIGRGPLVDTDALVQACAEGRIRAALDVVDPEPLPADHPLWTTTGVLLTPHVAGRTTTMLDRVVQLLEGQLARLVAGEEPHHRVL
ncbi:NAD(P)-dependent oxidoreductase [Luteococcus peritonei]|uniref:NAD(P)-dependent oxidoreductase n=1 Tax=Luteococcus peritonei TaxID=88874 RepID=A0ABW4RTV4_9ACTN